MNFYNDPEIIIKYWVNKNSEEETVYDSADVKEEIWKVIDGTNGVYEVSNYGRVKSHDIVQRRSNGKVMCDFHVKGRMLKQGKVGKKRDHYSVVICGKTTPVHRLVAEAFVPNPLNLPVVNHLDGNSLNNRADNLEWTTVKGNNRHAIQHGSFTMGEKSPYHKLTEDQVKEIRRVYVKGDKDFGVKPLARKYGVSSSAVRNIVKNRKWRHIK